MWKENKEFERQHISMSQPHLDSTPIGTNTSNEKIPPLDLTLVGAKMPDPKTPKLLTKLSKGKENLINSTYQSVWSETQVHRTHH